MKKKSIMIIAGEASGDLHGANLVKALRQKDPTLSFVGIGGRYLKDAGVDILIDAGELAVVGITEAIAKLPTLLNGLKQARHLLKTMVPDLLILIDFPDFNLRIASTAKKINIPILYYITPQIWAWRSGRVKKIKKLVDKVAVILPFEAEFYQKHDVPVTFVGHPLLDLESSLLSGNFLPKSPRYPLIGLLPGSRDGEITRHLPVMLGAAKIIRQKLPNARFIISCAPTASIEQIKAIGGSDYDPDYFEIVEKTAQAVFRQSTLAIAASGTVTLEAAITKTPLIIIYRVSFLSYWLGRALIRVKNIGLINLVAGKDLVPELIQNQATPEKIGNLAINMLSNPAQLEKMQEELQKVNKLLGGPGASDRVACMALDMIILNS